MILNYQIYTNKKSDMLNIRILSVKMWLQNAVATYSVGETIYFELLDQNAIIETIDIKGNTITLTLSIDENEEEFYELQFLATNYKATIKKQLIF